MSLVLYLASRDYFLLFGIRILFPLCLLFGTRSQSTYIQYKVNTLSLPSSQLGPFLNIPQASILPPPPPQPKGEGTHSPLGEGGSQFGRLEKKPSSLSTQCTRSLGVRVSGIVLRTHFLRCVYAHFLRSFSPATVCGERQE